jgi:hypothetical protein
MAKEITIKALMHQAWLLLIAISLLFTGCQEIELPPPIINPDKVFELKGELNGEPFTFSTEKYRLLTDYTIDSLGVRIFVTTFLFVDSSQEKISIAIRDNRIYEGKGDTAAVLLPGNYPFKGNRSVMGKTFYLKNSMNDEGATGLFWKYNDQIIPGPNFNIENVNPNSSYKICLQNNGSLQNTFLHYCRTFTPAHFKDKFDIAIEDFSVQSNIIKPKVDSQTCCNLLYRWNSTFVNTTGEFPVASSGNYALRVEGKNDHVADVELVLQIRDEQLQLPYFVGFTSSLEELEGEPSFSMATITYTDKSGRVYTTDNITGMSNHKIRIVESQLMNRKDDLGRDLQKVLLEFQAPLISEDGDSIFLSNFRGVVGFAIE